MFHLQMPCSVLESCASPGLSAQTVVGDFFQLHTDFADFYSSLEFLQLGDTAEPPGTARQVLPKAKPVPFLTAEGCP